MKKVDPNSPDFLEIKENKRKYFYKISTCSSK
jgi:hypothetical protein